MSAAIFAADLRSSHRGLEGYELLQLLHSSEHGLSAIDAEAILRAVGPNRIDSAKQKRLLTDFVGRFRNPSLAILLGAAVVSAGTADVPYYALSSS